MKASFSLLRKIWIVFCLFIIVFNPPIVNFNLLHVVALFSWLFILLNYKIIRERIDIRRIKNVGICFVLIMVFLGFTALGHDNSVLIIIDYFYFVFEIIPFCLFVVSTSDDSEKEVMIYLKIVAGLQALLAIVAFFAPSVKGYFNQRLISYGYGDVILSMVAYRQNGFASSLTSYASFFQAFMAVIFFFHALVNKKNRLYNLVLSLMVGFSAVINSRTAIVIMAVGALAIFFRKSSKNRNALGKKIIILLVVASCSFGIIKWMASLKSDTFLWLREGIGDIQNMLKGNVGGTTSFFYYYKDFWHVPSDLGLLFGKGAIIMGSSGQKYGFSSDVGFINDIWKGGIVYSLVLWIGFLRTIHKMVEIERVKKDFDFIFVLRYFIAVAVIINLKGFFFVKEAQTVFYFMFYVSLLGDKRNTIYLEENHNGDVIC